MSGVLCWVDVGPAFGLGHLSRARALAEALGERGLACRFAMPEDATARAWLASAGGRIGAILGDSEPALPRVLAAAAGADAVVVDVRHPLERAEVRALGGTRPVVVIDNDGPGVFSADLVLAPFGNARGERWLTWAEYTPLRRAFRLAGELRTQRPPSPLVLVSMGGSDPGGLAVPALEGVALARDRHPRLAARVVANPATPVWSRLPAVLRRHEFPPACAIDPSAMVGHLAEAALVVLAMGVTVYEAMACGVPAVVLCRTSADVAHARALAARGAIVSLGQHWTEERIGTAVGELLDAPGRCAVMSAAGRALVDGRGADRVADRITALVGRERAGRVPRSERGGVHA